MIRTKRTLSLARAIAGLIAMFSISSLATETNSTTNAKIGEHFRVVPAADGTNEVTMVGNGLNYQDTNGAWIASVPVVQTFPNAIVCTGASYRVILATNLNSLGSVDLELPADSATTNRGRMVSHPLGLAFYDPDSGATVLLAPLQDCSAQVVSNQVIFTDAFVHTNGIQGAVAYTYDVGHFHQDVTLTTKPTVTPADFGMGSNARLEMLTQFEQTPEPEITESTVSTGTSARTSAMLTQAETEPPATDQTLNYGTMRMGRGRAFATAAASPLNSLTVTKQLISVANQNFLTEDVPWAKAAETLQNLPEAPSGTNAQASVRHTLPRESMIAQLTARDSKSMAKVVQSFRDRLAEVQRSAPLQVASVQAMPSGFVLDYELVESCDDFTFESGNTYLISTYTQIGYLTIESNAVIKFSGGNLQPMWALNCPDSEPKAVLTDMNDDSVGEVISGSAGHFTTYHAYAALEMSGLDGYGSYTHNLDIRFVSVGISAPTIEGNWCYIYDSTFFKCGQGIYGSPDFAGLSSCDFCEVDTPYPSEFSDLYGITYCSSSVDRNGNGLPDDWEFNWFGNMSHSGSELDAVGNTILSDYENFASATATNDPNIIRFSINVTNNYVRTNSPKLSMDVSVGTAAYYAVLIDSTNFAGASWTSYTSTNLTASLGSTQGWHEVWIGLKGPATGATITWGWKRLKLDTTAPTIVITNLPSSTVKMPMIQIYGYSPEDLDSISCNVSNVLGLETNIDAGVTHRTYSTNTWEYTTNFFECLDVPLTNGVNVVRIYATDIAGNTTMLATNITLDYTGKTAPVPQLTWPQDGTILCGSNFTIRGQVDDPTLSVMATIVDTNNCTNMAYGMVERDGRFWVDDVPLSSGTNLVSVTFSNAAGQTTVTNFSVSQNAMTLTMDEISDPMQLWKPTINLTGTISDPTASIQVNGVSGVNNGDGTWHADNVPVSAGGVGIFDINAVPAGEDDPRISFNLDKPARLYLKEYDANDGGDALGVFNSVYGIQTFDWEASGSCTWYDGGGGDGTSFIDAYYGNVDFHGGYQHTAKNQNWAFPASNWPDVVVGENVETSEYDDDYGSSTGYTTSSIPVQVVFEHCMVQLPVGSSSGWPYRWEGSGFPESPLVKGKYHRQADATMELQTGGRTGSQRQSLFCLSGTAGKLKDKYDYPEVDDQKVVSWMSGRNPATTPISAQKITIDGMPLGSDGKRWRVYKDNTTRDVTPRVKGEDFYAFTVSQQKYRLLIQANSFVLRSTEVAPSAKFCVGQKVKFEAGWLPYEPSEITGSLTLHLWDFQGNFVNDHTNAIAGGALPNSSEQYFKRDDLLSHETATNWWTSGGYPFPGALYVAKFGEQLTFDNGQQVAIAVEGRMNMYRPQIDNYLPGSPEVKLIHGATKGSGWLKTLPWGQFWYTVHSAVPGTIGVTQLLKGYSTNQIVWGDSSNQFQLDASFMPLSEFAAVSDERIGDVCSLSDAPDVLTLGQRPTMHMEFKDYIRFQPWGDSNNILVTIGFVTWHDFGETHLVLDFMNDYDYYPLPPPAFIKADPSDTAMDSHDFNFSDFPFWKEKFQFRNR